MKLFEIHLKYEQEEEDDERERQRQREPERRQQRTTTQDPFDQPDLSAFQRGMDDQTQGTQNVPSKSDKKEEKKKSKVKLRGASAETTRARTAGIEMPADAGEKLSFLSRLGLQDEISDEDAAREAGLAFRQADAEAPAPFNVGVDPEPPETENLPANIETLPDLVNTAVQAGSAVVPEWHQVRNLPGYLASAIRALGRQVFGQFTKTRIEDIQVLANLGNGGQPNSQREMNAVAGWIKDAGERDTEGEMDFAQSIPDYGADFKIYNAGGFTFMLVKDEFGEYIYGWPEEDNKNQSANRRGIGQDRPRLS